MRGEITVIKKICGIALVFSLFIGSIVALKFECEATTFGRAATVIAGIAILYIPLFIVWIRPEKKKPEGVPTPDGR